VGFGDTFWLVESQRTTALGGKPVEEVMFLFCIPAIINAVTATAFVFGMNMPIWVVAIVWLAYHIFWMFLIVFRADLANQPQTEAFFGLKIFWVAVSSVFCVYFISAMALVWALKFHSGEWTAGASIAGSVACSVFGLSTLFFVLVARRLCDDNKK